MARVARPYASALCVALALPLPAQSRPQDGDLRQLLPAGAYLVASTRSGVALVDAIETFLMPLPPTLGQRLGPLLALGKLGIGSALGIGFEPLLELVAKGQVVAAVVATERGPAPLLLAAVAERDREHARALVRRHEGKAALALEDGVLRLAGRRDVLERVRDSGPAGRAPWRGADEPDGGGACIEVQADLDAVRRLGDGATLWSRLDAGGRLLLGPLAARLDAATSLSARVTIGATSLRASMRLESSEPAPEHPVRHLSGPAAAVLAPLPANGLARVLLPRAAEGLFAHADAVLSEEDAAKAKSFVSIADALLGGRSLVRDLLPALGPVGLYVLDEPGGEGPQPRIALPAFVLAAPLGTPRAEKMLKALFGNLTTIQAAERAQQGKQPFTASGEEVDGYAPQTLRLEGWSGVPPPPLEVGLSPTLLVAHGHAIVASTAQGALQLARSLAQPARDRVAGDEIVLRGRPLADLVVRNAGAVALGRMLDEGESPRTARWFVRALADTLLAVDVVRLAFTGSDLTLALEKAKTP